MEIESSQKVEELKMKKECYFSVETYLHATGSNMDALIYRNSLEEIRDDLLGFGKWDYAYVYKNEPYEPLFATIYRNGDIDYRYLDL